MTTPALKPCPWCGGSAYLVEGEECAYVQCEDMKMHRALWLDGDNAVANEVAEQWNRRADLHDATKAQLAKAHEKEIAVWSENYAALERKLAKAVEALRFYANFQEFYQTADAVLAEIEKGGV